MNINCLKEMKCIINENATCYKKRGQSFLDIGAIITYDLTGLFFWNYSTDMPKVNVDHLQTFVFNTLTQQGHTH